MDYGNTDVHRVRILVTYYSWLIRDARHTRPLPRLGHYCIRGHETEWF